VDTDTSECLSYDRDIFYCDIISSVDQYAFTCTRSDDEILDRHIGDAIYIHTVSTRAGYTEIAYDLSTLWLDRS
jgi:hypothetical protein